MLQQAFPVGQPENLIVQHRNDIVDGLIFLQRFSPCHASKNIEVYPFCSTYYLCGATVVPIPYKARIQRVYTLPAGRWCCPIYYTFISDYDTFWNWLIAKRSELKIPDNIGKPVLGHGMLIAEDTSDKGWRQGSGHYTIHDGKVLVGLNIESDERLVIEWQGIRYKYQNTDLIPIGIDFEDADVNLKDEAAPLINALAAKVLHENADRYTKDYAEADRQFAKWRMLVADLIQDCKQQLRPKIEPERRYDQQEVGVCSPESECEAVETSESSSATSSSSSSSSSSSEESSSSMCPTMQILHGDSDPDDPPPDPTITYIYINDTTMAQWMWHVPTQDWRIQLGNQTP